MERVSEVFEADQIPLLKQQMLNWCRRFNIFCFLDNHQYQSVHSSAECLLAAGAEQVFTGNRSISELQAFCDQPGKWIFGHIGYDYKNTLYPSLTSGHPDGAGFPDIFLFQPEILIRLENGKLRISSSTLSPCEIFGQISGALAPVTESFEPPDVQPRMTKTDYFSVFEKLQAHIRRGDCYEINFCQEFYSEDVRMDPWMVYQRLSALSPSPFGCFYRLDDKFLSCASPERYLRKKGGTIWSQPIKGTFRRGESAVEDMRFREALQNSAKEKAENVMIVDLVRNDLSRVCKKGSVRVEELFGIYTFPQVHQMISTITGELGAAVSFTDILSATFPMGSMTGAPKRRVMELLEHYERTKRGIYSGCVGYISPEKDFDFNVVIRSLVYNKTAKYLSYQAGGAITFSSVAEEEYAECLLKVQAIRNVLG